MTAMVTLEHDLRFRRPILWGTVGVLVVRLLMAIPLAAQSPEQQPSAPVNPAEALAEYQKELRTNPRSSLAHYHIAELLFSQRKYQASANACRDALRGEGIPSWTTVWSHIQLGEIFDVTGQRDRAVKEYQMAVQTEDNTRGALDKARELLQKPFEWPETH
jgi:tetratricopeptide (TPR) repeat protein